MRFTITLAGGRLLEGDTPYGRFRVEWDATNKLISESMEARTPVETSPSPTPATMRKIEPLCPSQVEYALDRALICNGCDQSNGVTLRAAGRAVYTVKCRACGCGGKSLLSGTCPRGKWQA